MVLLVSGVAGAIVAGLPTLAFQVALLLGAGGAAATLLMMRAGAVLNPAWVIVAWIYLIAPIGWIFTQVGVGLSPGALLVVAPSPFVLAALVMRPRSRHRLVLIAPLLALLFLAGISLLWSGDATYGAEKLNLWILTGFLPAVCILVLAPASSSVFWKAIVAAALISAIGLILVGADTALFPGRRTIFDANPIWLGRAAFIGALVVLVGPFPPLAKLTLAPVMIVAGLMTVSLGPTVGLLVGAWAGAAETLRCSNRTDRRVALGWGGLGLIGGIGVVIVLISVVDPDASALARLVVSDPNVTSRATYLGAAGSLFVQAPLFGIGLGGFATTGLDLYPHNLVAEIAVELGSVGILLFLGWFGLALRGAARSPLLVALLVATAVFSLFSGNLAGNAEFWMFSALSVAMLPIGDRGRKRQEEAAERGWAGARPPAYDLPGSGRA